MRAKRRRGSGDTSKYYFTSDTQAAIVEFQRTPSSVERHAVYVARIEPAFSTLVDNLIRINRFEGLMKQRDELKHDCISFLYETLGKFDPNRGSAAFSYFNVVAKNYLTVASKTRAARLKRGVSLDSGLVSRDDADRIRERHEHEPFASQSITLSEVMSSLAMQTGSFSAPEATCWAAIASIVDDDSLELKKMKIVTALRDRVGDQRIFSAGMSRLRERFKALRDA